MNKLKQYWYLVFFALTTVILFIIHPLSGSELVSLNWQSIITIVILFFLEEGIRKEKLILPLFKVANSVRSLPFLFFLLLLSSFVFSLFIFDFYTVLIFIPFTLKLLKESKKESYAPQLCALITLSSITSNAISPLGEANIYLFSSQDFSLSSFLSSTLPFTIIAIVIFSIEALLALRKSKGEEIYLHIKNEDYWENEKKGLRIFYIAFFLVLVFLRHFNTIDIFIVVALSLLIFDRSIFKKADYSILLTLLFVMLSSSILKLANFNLNEVISIVLTRLGALTLFGEDKIALNKTLISSFVSISLPLIFAIRELKEKKREFCISYLLLSLPFILLSLILFFIF